MMPKCCISSFVAKGLREMFRPALVGETHQCDICSRKYILDPTWREIAAPVAPLTLIVEDSDFDGPTH